MFGKSSYLRLATCRGIPIYFHILTPLGLLFLSNMRFSPGFWVGAVTVILLHEFGHAFVVSQLGLRPTAITILPFGGTCSYSGNPTELDDILISWGGVFAQMCLYAVVSLAVTAAGGFQNLVGHLGNHHFVADLLRTFQEWNLFLVGLNLLPIPPLDGHRAWRFIFLRR